MVFSGEFHPFRLPAPELWYDVLQKCAPDPSTATSIDSDVPRFKASGFNGVSVYCASAFILIGSHIIIYPVYAGHWGLSAPNPNEVRFTEHNDLAKFFQVAKDVGILVIVRPGCVLP